MGSSTNIDSFNAVINFVSSSCLITLKQISSSWGAIFVMQVCDVWSDMLLIWCVLNMCWIINNAVFVFRLNNCELTEKSCSVLATVLSSKTILKEMNLNNSRLLDSGVKEICEGLKKSKLNTLKWVHFTISYTQHHSIILYWKCSPTKVEIKKYPFPHCIYLFLI